MASFEVKTNAEIRDDILRVLKNGLIARGVATPNVLPGSEEFAKAQAIANEIEPLYANLQIVADELMPDTATGDGLARWLSVYQDGYRSAQGSHGQIVFDTTQTTTVTAGTELIDGIGQRFSVDISGTYADGDLINVSAVSTGSTTNHDEGDALRWVIQPAFANPTALVAVGGLIDGIDTEDDETARARLFDKLANPQQAGNWSQLSAFAEKSTGSVQKAFVYPAVNGPSTMHVAVIGYTTDTNKSRTISNTLLTGTVQPYMAGVPAEGTEIVTTDTADVNEDVSIAMTIPSAPTASPPGPGGGWVNGTPWPYPADTYTSCAVTAVTSSTVFRVRASIAPQANVTRICWQSYTAGDWALYTATVISYTNPSTDIYEVTLDQPFTDIAVGDYISPLAENSSVYFAALIAAFAKMGPGEKTTSAGPLVRGYRHPLPAAGWPYKVGTNLLKALTDSGDEVSDASFLYRLSGGAAPGVPGSISGSPKVYVPRRLAIYPSI